MYGGEDGERGGRGEEVERGKNEFNLLRVNLVGVE